MKRTHLVVSGILVAFVVAGLWIAASQARTDSYLSVAELRRRNPTGEVYTGGNVLSSSMPGETLRLVIVDEARSTHDRLTLQYSGAQRLSFGPGVTVIAHGSLRNDGVFVVTEFVTKKP